MEISEVAKGWVERWSYEVGDSKRDEFEWVDEFEYVATHEIHACCCSDIGQCNISYSFFLTIVFSFYVKSKSRVSTHYWWSRYGGFVLFLTDQKRHQNSCTRSYSNVGYGCGADVSRRVFISYRYVGMKLDR